MKVEGCFDIPGVVNPNKAICQKYCMKPKFGTYPKRHCIHSFKTAVSLVKIEDLLMVPDGCPYRLEHIVSKEK